MALAPTEKVVLGSVAFALFWVLAVFPAIPFLPIGRTAGSLLGAMLMVIFRVITPEEAYSAVDLSILGLLFGTMVVSVYLESADIFKHLGKLLSWKSWGPKDLLCRICLVSAISSALFTNDTSCVVLTEFILKIARQNNVPPHPFLLALASSANIGSSATPIGNPQNLVIAIKARISFGGFLLGIAPAMLVGVLMNVFILLCMYWRVLSVGRDVENALGGVVSEEDASSHRFSPATMSHPSSPDHHESSLISRAESMKLSPAANVTDMSHAETLRNRLPSSEIHGHEGSAARDHVLSISSSRSEELELVSCQNIPNPSGKMEMEASGDQENPRLPVEERKPLCKRWKRLSWKSCVYLVTIGMMVALLIGLNMSWTALTAALVLVVLDFKDARACLDKVSYSILIFFCGMFITVEGFNKTGIPSTLWNLTEPHARINHVAGLIVLSLVILVLSNVASNVPTVLLLGTRVAASAAAISSSEETKAWLILAWVSTVAGNLSLLGSAANLIVCEQARRAKGCGYTLSFWSHLKFGIPSTVIVTAIGLLLIKG